MENQNILEHGAVPQQTKATAAGWSVPLARQWVVFGLIAGLLGDAAYVASLVIAGVSPEPSYVAFLLGAALGPGVSLGFVGLYYFISQHRNSPMLQAATLFGVSAGVIVNAMLVVQSALALGFEQSTKEALGQSWDVVWMIQQGLDVSWDIYLTLGMLLLGVAMWRHPRLGPVFGAITVLIGGSLLTLNLATFPSPPASAGMVDLGPLSGAWFAVLSLRALTSLRWIEAGGYDGIASS